LMGGRDSHPLGRTALASMVSAYAHQVDSLHNPTVTVMVSLSADCAAPSDSSSPASIT
jgi:hypothetical protein